MTVTRDDEGNVFTTGQGDGQGHDHPLASRDRPQRASVAVRHRGWWFYIADDDQTSKPTFGLLNILFSLQSSSGEGKCAVC